MTQSPYTITLVPSGTATVLTLVAAGTFLDTLPTWDATQGLFESDGVNLGNAYFRPLGGVTVSMRLAVEDEHGDLAAALDALLDAGLAGASDLLQVSGALTLTPISGAPHVFSEALVTDVTPDLPSGPTATSTRAFIIHTTLPD